MPDRLSDVINVKDWGALGNKSHNDAPNIQAAIDFCISRGAAEYFFLRASINVPRDLS